VILTHTLCNTFLYKSWFSGFLKGHQIEECSIGLDPYLFNSVVGRQWRKSSVKMYRKVGQSNVGGQDLRTTLKILGCITTENFLTSRLIKSTNFLWNNPVLGMFDGIVLYLEYLTEQSCTWNFWGNSPILGVFDGTVLYLEFLTEQFCTWNFWRNSPVLGILTEQFCTLNFWRNNSVLGIFEGTVLYLDFWRNTAVVGIFDGTVLYLEFLTEQSCTWNFRRSSSVLGIIDGTVLCLEFLRE
jgi:branched-subunit amino acid transport protein AzlD